MKFPLLGLLLLLPLIANANFEYMDVNIESRHPYANDTLDKKELLNIKAKALKLEFSKIVLAQGDRIIIENEDEDVVQVIDGPIHHQNFMSDLIPGRKAIIKLESDIHLNQYGYKVKGLHYKKLTTHKPIAIHHQAFPLHRNAFHLGEVKYFFDGNQFYANQQIFHDNGLPISNKIIRRSINHLGSVDLDSVRIFQKGFGPLLKWKGKLLTVSNGDLVDVKTRFKFSMYRPYFKASQILRNGRMIYILSAGRVHIIDTKGEDGWQYTQESKDLIKSTGETGRISLHKNYLVNNMSWYKKKIEIYDISDPYSPDILREIPIDGENDDRWTLARWTPSVSNDHLFLPKGKNLSVIDINSGIEVAFLQFPEVIGKTANTFSIDDETLYVTGHSTVYRVDISNPTSPMIIDGTRITRDPQSLGIQSVHKDGDYLYILRRNRTYSLGKPEGVSLSIVLLPTE